MRWSGCSQRVRIMEPQTLAAEIWAYYAGLGEEGRGVLKAFAWMMSLALLTDLGSRLAPKKDEDPLKVVLAEPVGVWADRQRMREMPETQAKKTSPPKPCAPFHISPPDANPQKKKRALSMPRPHFRLPALKMSLPSFKIPARRKKSSSSTEPIPEESPEPIMRKKSQEAESQPKKSSTPRQERNDACPFEPFDGPPAMPSRVVAEIDFLKAAGRDGLIGLKAAFGTVHVPSESYSEACLLLEAHGLDGSLCLSPISVGGGSAYPSIDAAKRLGAAVLSDSSNLRRICRAGGTPTWSSHEWRLIAPKPC